jgi:hypothetical protein
MSPDFYVRFSGALELFDNYLGAQVEVDDSHFKILLDVSLLNSFFTFHLACTSVGTMPHPTDFQVEAYVFPCNPTVARRRVFIFSVLCCFVRSSRVTPSL